MECPRCDSSTLQRGGWLHIVHICPLCGYLTTAACDGCMGCHLPAKEVNVCHESIARSCGSMAIVENQLAAKAAKKERNK